MRPPLSFRRLVRRLLRGTLAAAAIASLSGCGDGNSPTSPGGGSATITAIVDGQAWASAAAARAETDQAGRLTIVGSRTAGLAGDTLTIVVGYVTGPGTYPLGVNHISTSGGIATFSQGTTSWNTPLSGASGSITISSLTAARVAGTFQFTATATAPATGTKTISSGTFDVPFTTPFTVSQERGGAVSAMINGSIWNAATAAALGSGGTFGFAGSNLTYDLTLGAQAFQAGVTYALGNGTGKAMLTVTLQAPGVTGVWGGHATDVGTVTFTSIDGRRATGTFAGVLSPQGLTGGSTMSIANGVFDVRIVP
ncbi:MAG: hypothetical protein IT184_13095 [Acidobacteria bacterium]|nr:hypothetical protein [Acidobacteriota bacterium]